MNKIGYVVFAVSFVFVMLLVMAPNFGNEIITSFNNPVETEIEIDEQLFETPILLEKTDKYKHEQIGENTFKYTFN